MQMVSYRSIRLVTLLHLTPSLALPHFASLPSPLSHWNKKLAPSPLLVNPTDHPLFSDMISLLIIDTPYPYLYLFSNYSLRKYTYFSAQELLRPARGRTLADMTVKFSRGFAVLM